MLQRIRNFSNFFLELLEKITGKPQGREIYPGAGIFETGKLCLHRGPDRINLLQAVENVGNGWFGRKIVYWCPACDGIASPSISKRPFAPHGRFISVQNFETDRPCKKCGGFLHEQWGPEAPGSSETVLEWCPTCDKTARVVASRSIEIEWYPAWGQ